GRVGAAGGAVVQHQALGGERQAPALCGDCVEPAQQELALGGVHHAVGQLEVARWAPPYFDGRRAHRPCAAVATLAFRLPPRSRCASTSSTPRPTRPPTTTRCAA